MSSIGIVILAAGASTRMGTPKQLLPYVGQTLLRRAAETAVASQGRPVVVVLGAAAQLCRAELEGLPVHIVENPEWEQGMSGSLSVGMEALLEVTAHSVRAVIFMLCDQPLVSANLLNALIQTHGVTGKCIVASAYAGTRGVPALFCKELFSHIDALRGNEGAKKIIAGNPDEVVSVDFPGGAVDVDTPESYAILGVDAWQWGTAKVHLNDV